MKRNVEIKARVRDPEALAALAAALGVVEADLVAGAYVDLLAGEGETP